MFKKVVPLAIIVFSVIYFAMTNEGFPITKTPASWVSVNNTTFGKNIPANVSDAQAAFEALNAMNATGGGGGPVNTPVNGTKFFNGYNNTTGVFNTADVVGGVTSVNGQTGAVNLTTANVTDTVNKRYVTDGNLAVLANTTNTNSGDQDLSGLVPKTTTVNGHALNANVTVSKSDVGLGNVTDVDTTTTANITDSTNKRFVTDAKLAVLNNTTNTNTGDQDLSVFYNKTISDGRYLGINDTAANATLFAGHNTSYFQPAGSYLTNETDPIFNVSAAKNITPSQATSISRYANATQDGLLDPGNFSAFAFPQATKRQIAQASHGFSVGNVLTYNGTAYTLAKADSAVNAEVVGIVSNVTDSGNFTLTEDGFISGASGYTGGQVHFLSDTSAGNLTVTEPSAANAVSKPLLFAINATAGYFRNMRGSLTGVAPGISGTTNSTFQIDANNNGPRIKNNAGTLEVRNATDSAYAPLLASSVTDGTATMTGGTLTGATLASGTIATTQTAGDNSTKVATTAFVLANSGTRPTSQIYVSTGNGFGSTNTKIRRFSNIESTTGTAITYADSATAGGLFTINRAGVYAVNYWDGNTGTRIGISKNSTELTTAIQSIIAINRVAQTQTIATTFGECGTVIRCAVNDTIRAHTDGTAMADGSAQTGFIITQVSDI